MGSHLNQVIMSLLSDRKTVQNHSILKDTNILSDIELYLKSISDKSFLTISTIMECSDGLVKEQNKVSLKEDWGVMLTNKIHANFVENPTNIRTNNDGSKFFLTNSSPSTSTVGNAVLDKNLNLIGLIGKKGTSYASGQYRVASDFSYNMKWKKYYVASEIDHVVQIYNEDGSYSSTIGTGATAGIALGELNSPVAVATGRTSLYIANKTGTVAGASGEGFISAYNAADNSFIDNVLWPGLRGGSGKVFEGEILKPRDMVVMEGSYDKLIILNDTEEIGIFDSRTWALEDIINIPSQYQTGQTNALGLTKLCVKDQILYVTAQNVGQIIAIDLTTKKLLGNFGYVKSETTLDSPQTLGVYNGLSGVVVYNDRVITTETLNNRVQVIGKSLLTSSPTFYAITETVKVPLDKSLVAVTMDITNDLPSGMKIIDQRDLKEYDLHTAINKDVTHFAVKLEISPSVFTSKKKQYEIYPIWVNVEV